MKITINLDKVAKFVHQHQEAIAVACFAVIVTRRRTKAYKSMSNFIISTGLEDNYCQFIKK
jgi:hypothetical protein